MNRKILFILFIILMGLIGLNIANADTIDDFNRADNDAPGGGWTEKSVDCDISNNQLLCSVGGGQNAKVNRVYNTKQSWDLVTELNRTTVDSGFAIFCVNGNDDAGASTDGTNCAYKANSGGALSIHINAVSKNSSGAIALTSGLKYFMRFQYNLSGNEKMRAKIWEKTIPEPAQWNVTFKVNGTNLIKNSYMEFMTWAGDGGVYFDNVTNETSVSPAVTAQQSWQIDRNFSNSSNYETFIGLFTLNTSFNSSNVTNINAKLNFSGTLYEPIKLNSTANPAGINATANFTANVTHDLINLDFTNYSHQWEINITWANGSNELTNSSPRNLTIRWAYILNSSSFVSNRTDWETFFTHLRFDFFNNSNAATLTNSRIGYNGTNLTTSINSTTIYSNATIGLEDNNNTIHNVQVNLSVVFNSIAINRTFNVSQRISWGYWITNFTIGDGSNQTVEDSNISIRFYFNNISRPVNLTPRIRWDNATYLANLNPITNFAEINISIPFINTTNITIDIFGNLTINFSGREVSRTNLTNAFVYRMTLTDCTGGLTSTEAINFTFRDEDTEQLRVTELDINFDLSKSGSNTKNLSFTRTGADSYKFCLYPKWFEFNVDAIADYQASTFSSYAIRSYFLNNVNVSNTTVYIRPYHINTSVSSNVQLTVTDTNDIPISNMYVKALRYYPESNTFRTVEIGRTGTNGEVILKLQLNNVWYKFLFVDSNEITRLESATTKITSTSLFYTINLLSSFLSIFNDVRNIEHSLTYNNATGVARFTFNDPTGIVREGCLEVTQRDSYGDRRICRSCTASTAATILCTVGTNLSGTYILRGYIDTNTANSNYIIDYVELFLDDAWEVFGTTGYGLFMAAIFITAIMLLGIWNLGVAFGLGIVGIFIMKYLGIISLAGSTLMLFIIIAMALLMKSRT